MLMMVGMASVTIREGTGVSSILVRWSGGVHGAGADETGAFPHFFPDSESSRPGAATPDREGRGHCSLFLSFYTDFSSMARKKAGTPIR